MRIISQLRGTPISGLDIGTSIGRFIATGVRIPLTGVDSSVEYYRYRWFVGRTESISR